MIPGGLPQVAGFFGKFSATGGKMGFTACQKLPMAAVFCKGHGTAGICRRHKVCQKLFREPGVPQLHFQSGLLPQIDLLKMHLIPVAHIDHQIAGACFKAGKTVLVRIGLPEGVQFAVVDDLKTHPGTADGCVIFCDLHGQTPGAGVPGGAVDGLI